MVATVYFVSSYLHVVSNDGWSFKVENKYTDLSAAKKAFHALLGNYIDNEAYDSVCVMLTDSMGNPIQTEYWFEPEE